MIKDASLTRLVFARWVSFFMMDLIVPSGFINSADYIGEQLFKNEGNSNMIWSMHSMRLVCRFVKWRPFIHAEKLE